MKLFILFLLVLAPSLLADALKFKDTDGKTYAGELAAVEPHAIAIETDSGIIRVPFEKLPPEMQKRFNYDPAKAAEYKNALAVQQAAALAVGGNGTGPRVADDAGPIHGGGPRLSEYEQAKANWIKTAGKKPVAASVAQAPDGHLYDANKITGIMPDYLKSEKAYYEWKAASAKKSAQKTGKLYSGGL